MKHKPRDITTENPARIRQLLDELAVSPDPAAFTALLELQADLGLGLRAIRTNPRRGQLLEQSGRSRWDEPPGRVGSLALHPMILVDAAGRRIWGISGMSSSRVVVG